MSSEIIPTHGGYRKLKSFQVAQLAYDVTVRFCDKYIERRSRTHDQMVQAARSGVQNIAEGSQTSSTSRKMELKLTNVARASLEELRLDYEDFIRHRRLALWEPNDPRRAELVARRCQTADDVARWALDVHRAAEKVAQVAPGGLSGQNEPRGQAPSIEATSSTKPTITIPTYPEIIANGALVLINVAATLLDRQIDSLAKLFEKEGGFTERLYRVRSARRKER
ncbi:MAG TPA: four helix bundle suffix domain-containing protein [Candidatus Kapabacteria bacterium]|nr:four helix bundle suffix domain-containing protein [Candidatus Kapabacteria bacterium]